MAGNGGALRGMAVMFARIFCLIRLGRLDEARKTVRQMSALWPEFTLSAWRHRMPYRPHVADTIFALLRQAGYPE